MRITVDDLQGRIAAIVDEDDVTTNISSTVYSLRLKYLNMALLEWAEAHDWQVLYKEFHSRISTSTGNASVVMPSDYRKLSSYPLITWNGTTTDKFPEILPQDNGQYGDNETDKRVAILGNPNSQYIMRVYGVTLVSGASLMVPYYSSPASLATSSDVASVPNPDYLVKRTIAYFWETRNDPRATSAKQEAQSILQNMISQENVFNRASAYGTVKTQEETKYNFVWGRD